MGSDARMRVHRAGASEAGVVRNIFEEYYDAIGVLVRDDPTQFAAYFEDGSGVWLASAGCEVAGCVALRPIATRPAACEVKRLYVRPAHRGAGIATALMDELEAYAARHAFRYVYLDTKDDLETAIRFYRQRGYETCERYNDNPQATVFMRYRIPSPAPADA